MSRFRNIPLAPVLLLVAFVVSSILAGISKEWWTFSVRMVSIAVAVLVAASPGILGLLLEWVARDRQDWDEGWIQVWLKKIPYFGNSLRGIHWTLAGAGLALGVYVVMDYLYDHMGRHEFFYPGRSLVWMEATHDAAAKCAAIMFVITFLGRGLWATIQEFELRTEIARVSAGVMNVIKLGSWIVSLIMSSISLIIPSSKGEKLAAVTAGDGGDVDLDDSEAEEDDDENN